MKNLLIVTGCPGTGKSCWARILKARFPTLEVFAYDAVKERYFDLFGFDNSQEKLRVNELSLKVYYLELGEKLARGGDLLIEYPFNRHHAPELARLAGAHACRTVTIFLHGRMDVIYARAQARDETGDGAHARHPGHLLSCYHAGRTTSAAHADADTFMTCEQFAESCARKDYDICIGRNLPVDVTELDKIDYPAVFAEICAATTLR